MVTVVPNVCPLKLSHNKKKQETEKKIKKNKKATMKTEKKNIYLMCSDDVLGRRLSSWNGGPVTEAVSFLFMV